MSGSFRRICEMVSRVGSTRLMIDGALAYGSLNLRIAFIGKPPAGHQTTNSTPKVSGVRRRIKQCQLAFLEWAVLTWARTTFWPFMVIHYTPTNGVDRNGSKPVIAVAIAGKGACRQKHDGE